MIDSKKNILQYLEKTKYYPVSSTLFETVLMTNKYEKRALDLGCGSLRDSKYLSNCGYIVDAVDIHPAVKKYKDFFKFRPKESFNLIITDYIKYSFGKDKYDIINAQNTLSFNDKNKIKQLIEKIYKSLKKEGYFSGNVFGVRDDRIKTKNGKMSFYKVEELKTLLKKFNIVKIVETEEDDEFSKGWKKHMHYINFIARK